MANQYDSSVSSLGVSSSEGSNRAPADTTPQRSSNSEWSWLIRRQLDDLGMQVRTVWDLYLKWYTVFLTANVAGLALTVQYVHPEHRKPVVWAFILQNFISSFTALSVGIFSERSARRATELAAEIILPEMCSAKDRKLILKSTIPGRLGLWSGIANLLSHAAMILCWYFVIEM